MLSFDSMHNEKTPALQLAKEGSAMKKTLLSICVAAFAAGPALAADLPVKARPMPAPIPVFSWTGFYIGLNIGGKWADVDHTVTNGATTFDFTRDTASSVIGGGQLGYNWQVGAWVFGIEGDIDAQDFNRSRVIGTAIGPFVPGDAFSLESRWQASLRGRIGYAAWDRTLLYVTGGGAWTQVKGTASLVGLGVFTNDTTVSGGTVGGGLEYAFTNNLTLGIEGRWTFYGDHTFTGGTLAGLPVSDKISLDTAEVMGKINYKFW
jgi:outer membrane immunogenic protein